VTVKLLHGDCLEMLTTLDADSIHACVTDPPYELGFMGKSWDGSGVAFEAETWRQVLLVLKPGAHLLAFGGTRTYHRMVCAIEDAGFEIRDCLAWLFGSGFPKSLNLKDEWDGWGTALKPAHEPIVVARKPLIGTVASNVAEHGTGALNINGCRVDTEESLNGGRYSDNKQGYDGNAYGEGINLRSVNDYVQPPGRWPANVIHDGSDEVVALFPETKSGALNAGHKRGSGVTSYDGGGGVIARNYGNDAGSGARFFYCAKASREDRDDGLEHLEKRALAYGNQAQAEVKRGNLEHKGNSGINTVKMRGNHHPTVKPTELMRWLVRLVTPPGGTVLDPFMGSGSTGRACVMEGFDFIGIERETDYVNIAKARIRAIAPLFADVA
jgi:DNA modification methylase